MRGDLRRGASSRRTAMVAALLCLTGLACERVDVATGPLVRDSAGVIIVENDQTQPRWTAPWVLSEDPVLRIGTAEGDTAQLLYRVTDARELPDGRVLVVNSGSSQVRIYSSDGRLLLTLGRRGDGPGEFRSPWQAYPMRGDSILVVDLYREVAIFAPDGAYAREFTPDLPSGLLVREGAEPVDQFGDGSLLFRGNTLPDPSWEGVRKIVVQMLRIPLDGSLVESLGEFDDQTFHYGRPRRDYALGARAQEAAAQSTMWYGPGDRLELREVTLDGTLLRLVRLDRRARPITEFDRDRYREDYTRQMDLWNPGRGDEFWRRRAAEALFPDSLPVHQQIETDPLGNVWVQDYLSPLSEARVARKWSVFDAEGAFLGDVMVPGGLLVHHISDRHIVGTWTDEFGVEYVHLYRIERPLP